MKKAIITRNMRSFAAFLVGGLVLLGLGACNKDFAYRLSFDEPPGDLRIRATEHKTAYIVVEGGVGAIVAQQARDIGAMPTLGRLATNAMVSWNAVSADSKESLTSYADLLTGTERPKHQVAGDGSGNNLANYPTLFKRIAEHTDMRTALITANTDLNILVQPADVDSYAVVADDAEATDKAVAELGREDAGLVVATFKEVDAAGQASGYDSPAYVQALGTFDQRLKRLADAIAVRENYANERWLIIVASTKGGAYALPPGQDDGSIFSETERNNFVVMHSPQFAFRLYQRMETVDPAWTSSAVRYTSSAGRALIAPDKAAIYNIEKGKEYTIQMKIKVHSYGTFNQTVLSKRSSTSGGEDGWAFMIGREAVSGRDWSSGSFRFKVGGTEIYATDPVELDVWHSVLARVWMDGAAQRVTMFRDGVPYNTGTITNATGSSSQPLQLGYASGFATSTATQSHSIADVRMYNVAKSVADIQSGYCTTLSTPGSDPYYGNLIGYWPGDDGGSELKDRSGNNNHFDLTGSYTWINFSERSASLCPTLPDNPERFVVRSVDIPRLLFGWINLMNIEDFDLDAQIWNPVFTHP